VGESVSLQIKTILLKFASTINELNSVINKLKPILF